MRGRLVLFFAIGTLACGAFSAPPDAGDATDASVADAVATEGGESDAADDASVDAIATCPSETCASFPLCKYYDFGTCAGWSTDGDSAAVHTCTGGKLRTAATNTLDATGYVALTTPSAPYAIHVAARLSVTTWDGGPVLRVKLNGNDVAQIKASDPAGGTTVDLLFCRAVNDCPGPKVPVEVGVEHQISIDLTDAGAVATVDCLPLGAVLASAFPLSTTLQVHFGKVDAEPIEGTLDDVVVRFVQ